MQLQELVGRVRKTLGEVEDNGYGSQLPGDGSWDNSQIIGYLNEALGIMARDWRKEALSTITVQNANQTDFPFPTDSLEDGTRTVLYSSSGTSYPIHSVDLETYNIYASGGNSTGVGMPQYVYTVWSGNIKIWPGANVAGDTIQIYYYRLPNKLVAPASVPEIPDRFHQALTFYALRECQNAVEETNLEGDVGSKWDRELSRFRVEMARNQRNIKGIRVRGRR